MSFFKAVSVNSINEISLNELSAKEYVWRRNRI